MSGMQCVMLRGKSDSSWQTLGQHHGGTQQAMCCLDCTKGMLRRLVGVILLVHI